MMSPCTDTFGLTAKMPDVNVSRLISQIGPKIQFQQIGQLLDAMIDDGLIGALFVSLCQPHSCHADRPCSHHIGRLPIAHIDARLGG